MNLSRELSILPASISLLGDTLPLLQKNSEKVICSHMFQAKAPSAFREWCDSPVLSVTSLGCSTRLCVSPVRTKELKNLSVKMENLDFQAEQPFLPDSHKLSKCRTFNPDLLLDSLC